MVVAEKPLAYQCDERPRPLVEHWWEHQLTDLLGLPTGPLHRVKGNSWVANMAVQMRTRLSLTDTNGVDFSGVTRAMTNGVTATKCWSLQLVALPVGAGINNRGIQVGTQAGPPAEDTTDFDVAGRVSNGSGGGQLLVQDDVMHALVTISGGFRIFHEKLYLNQSGASITITNVGIFANSNFGVSSTGFLYARDNITIVVPNSSGVLVKFREDWTV